MIFDPKKVNVIVDGRFLTGFSEGSIVSAEMVEDRQTPHIGVMGDVDFSLNANNAGTLTVTLKSTSPSIGFLNTLANQKKVFAVSVVNLNENGVSADGTQAILMNPVMPDQGKEVSEAEFEIYVGDLTID